MPKDRLPASVDLQQRMAAALATPETPEANDPGSALSHPFASIAADAAAAPPPAPAAQDAATPPAEAGSAASAASAVAATPPAAAPPSPADAVGTPSPAAAPPPASPADAVAAPAAAATPSAAPAAAAADPAAAPAPAPAAGAAPPAAASPADAVQAATPPPGYEAVEIEEAPGASATVFVPAGVGDTIRRGYLRQRDYTQKTMAFGRHRDFLLPLVEPGPQGRTAMDDLAPLMDRALRDPGFGQRVVDLYTRAQQGRPMVFADEVPQQQPVGYPQAGGQPGYAQPQPQPGQPGLAAALPQEWQDDPIFGPVVAAFDQRTVALEQRLSQLSGTYEQQQQQQRAAAEHQQRVAQVAQVARQTLASTYPDEYGGTNAEQNLMTLWNYANQYGFVANAGGDPIAGMLAAKAYSDRAAREFRPQGQTSVAAQTLADHNAMAQRTAAQVAGSIAPPSGAAVSSGTPAPVPFKPILRDEKGNRLAPAEAVRRSLAAATASGVS